MRPLASIAAILRGGAKWVPGRFPKVAIESPVVLIPANATSRVCLPVQNSVSGSFDEIEIDQSLGIHEYAYPHKIDSDINYLQYLLGGSNEQLLLTLPPLLLPEGRSTVRPISREEALIGALDGMLTVLLEGG